MGHISVDYITTNRGERVQPGGAALYSAVGARVFNDHVAILSNISSNYEFRSEIRRLFPHAHIRIRKGRSSRFRIHYTQRGEAQYLASRIGVGKYLTAEEIYRIGRRYQLIHLAPMNPNKVLKAVLKLKMDDQHKVITHNTWMGYMYGKNRRLLMEIAKHTSFFILSEREIKKLTRMNSSFDAIKKIEGRVIVTLGELGAIYKEGDEISMIPAAVGIPGEVVDVTGAGDVWCGAFISAYGLTRDIHKSAIAGSLLSSLKCRGWGFEKIVRLKFRSVDELIEYVVRLKEKKHRSLREYTN